MLKLNNQEKVLKAKRRHIFILIMSLIPFFFLILATLLFMLLLPFFYREPEIASTIYDYLGDFNLLFFIYFLLTLFLLILWKATFLVVSSYYFDCWIITNQRTIHTELKNLFSRYISSIHHHRIQDISVDVKGIFATHLNYGDLQIQTAGKFREFVFKQIPKPYKTKRDLMEAQKVFLRRKGLRK